MSSRLLNVALFPKPEWRLPRAPHLPSSHCPAPLSHAPLIHLLWDIDSPCLFILPWYISSSWNGLNLLILSWASFPDKKKKKSSREEESWEYPPVDSYGSFYAQEHRCLYSHSPSSQADYINPSTLEELLNIHWKKKKKNLSCAAVCCTYFIHRQNISELHCLPVGDSTHTRGLARPPLWWKDVQLCRVGLSAAFQFCTLSVLSHESASVARAHKLVVLLIST